MTRHETDADLTRPGTENRTETTDTTASDGPLAGIRRTETVADRTDFDRLRAELPDGWRAKPDIVQFGSGPLAETVTFERTATDPKLILKPTDPSDPGGEIEFHERSEARVARRSTRTVDTLQRALRVAVNRVHQFDA